MKGFMSMVMPRRMSRMAMIERMDLMMRRSANRNAHMITAHGKIMAGRKGRKG